MIEYEALEYAIGALKGLGAMANKKGTYTEAQLKNHDEVIAALVVRMELLEDA